MKIKNILHPFLASTFFLVGSLEAHSDIHGLFKGLRYPDHLNKVVGDFLDKTSIPTASHEKPFDLSSLIYKTSSETFSKPREWEDFGRRGNHSNDTKYQRLEKEFAIVEGKICKRTFHYFDSLGFCICQIVDDGCSEKPEDLTRVTYRKITRTQPLTTPPCTGLPEIVEEKTIDSLGNEILLHKVKYTYNQLGKVITEEHFDAKDVFRYQLINDYDALGRLIATTDALGQKTVFFYDENHNVVEIQGPGYEMQTIITYDKVNRPLRIEERQMDGSYLTYQILYDKRGMIAAVIDPCGQRTCYIYDQLGRNIKTMYPDGSCEEKDYDVLGNVIYEKDPNGYVTRREYDFKGNLLHVSYPDGSEESTTYHPNGTIASQIDRHGAITTYTYDAFGHAIQTVITSSDQKDFKTTSAKWTPFFQTSSVDEEKRETLYRYDFAGRKTKEKFKDRVTRFFYDDLGRLYRKEEGDVVTIEEFDLLNRPLEKRIERKDGKLLRKQRCVYDARGNVTHVITSKGVTETLYDAQGRLLYQKDPLGQETHYSYLYKGQFVTTITYPDGQQCITMHDARERPIESMIKNAEGDVIQHTENQYDRNGNLVQKLENIFVGIKPKKTVTHSWYYGPMNRLERSLEAEIRETVYQYDEKGRLKTVTKPDQNMLNYEYDGFGRLSRYSSTDFDYRYTYDKNDRIVAMNDVIARTSLSKEYNYYGYLHKETLANGLKLEYDTDPWGHRISMVLPDKSLVYYSYQGDDLYQVSRKNVSCTYLERDLEGYPTLIKLPGNLGNLSIERDPLFRITKLHSTHYTMTCSPTSYDSVGNLLHYQSKDPLGSEQLHFEYDGLHQLIKENGHHYLYDSSFNRVQKDDQNYELNSLSQIMNDGICSYVYDANGNMINNETCSLEYDTQDRLVEVIKGKTKVEFSYDCFGRRQSKKVYQNNKLQTTSLYLWDQDQEVGLIDMKGKMIELRVLGSDGMPLFYELNGKTYAPLQDLQGSVASLIDVASNKPIDTYRYTAYGEQLAGKDLSPWRFLNQRYDSETDLIGMDQRYYSPKIGRWVTPSSQGLQSEHNLYDYAHNAPIKRFKN